MVRLLSKHEAKARYYYKKQIQKRGNYLSLLALASAEALCPEFGQHFKRKV